MVRLDHKKDNNINQNKALRNSIIILMITILIKWFQDDLIDAIPFYMVMIISLIEFFIIIVVIRQILTDISKKDYLSLIVSIVTIVLIIFIPFRKIRTNVELNIYDKPRLEVINLVKNDKLKSDEHNNIVLPKKYKRVSASGEVHLYYKDEDNIVLGFWIFRGIVGSGTTQLIYTSFDDKLLKENVSYIEKTSCETKGNGNFCKNEVFLT